MFLVSSCLGKILFFKYLYWNWSCLIFNFDCISFGICVELELFVYIKSVFDWFLGCGGIIILVVGESWEIMIFNYLSNYNRGV